MTFASDSGLFLGDLDSCTFDFMVSCCVTLGQVHVLEGPPLFLVQVEGVEWQLANFDAVDIVIPFGVERAHAVAVIDKDLLSFRNELRRLDATDSTVPVGQGL